MEDGAKYEKKHSSGHGKHPSVRFSSAQQQRPKQQKPTICSVKPEAQPKTLFQFNPDMGSHVQCPFHVQTIDG